ncbi:MAG TPA: DUF692 family protein [Polyangia bacterium]
MPGFAPPAQRGVGFSYLPGISAALIAQPGLVDFLELSPDILCREVNGPGGARLAFHAPLLQEGLPVLAARPLVVHGLGLSIGSHAGWNTGYLALLDELHHHVPFAWHSEHLAFLQTVDRRGRALHVGVPLPLPFTDEALDLLAPRAAALGDRYGVPFLLENFTYYLPGLPSDRGRDEVAFLNELTERSGCGLLLDLYNFYCNAMNFGFDPFAALARLRLDRVVEIHVAGGSEFAGFHMDVHSQVVPDAVWRLLDFVVVRAPNLAGIVYEVLEQAVDHVGPGRIAQQLRRVREAWAAQQGVFGARGAPGAPTGVRVSAVETRSAGVAR